MPKLTLLFLSVLYNYHFSLLELNEPKCNNNNNNKFIAYIALFTVKRSIALYIIRSIKLTSKIIRVFIVS